MVKTHTKQYKKSTPVSRLLHNVDKAAKISALVRERLDGWRVPESVTGISEASATAASIGVLVGVLRKQVSALQEGGFVPPRRSSAYKPKVGDKVKVLEKYRSKYEVAYAANLRGDAKLLDELVVSAVLPSGEVSASRAVLPSGEAASSRSQASILVRKSHLVQVRA
jgi:hypothetical protein